MPSLRSSVLIIGHPNPAAIAFGADFAAGFSEAREALIEFRYPVIALPISQRFENEAVALLEYANQASPHSQRVIIQNDSRAEALQTVINTGSVFRVLSAYDDPRFDLTIEEALEEFRLLQQNVKLLQLVNEKNESLKKLTTELEERVEARRRSLEEAKERLLVTNHRVEALHRALVAIHRAGSIAEMERLINEALSGAIGLSWTRILYQAQARIDGSVPLNPKIVAIHRVPLTRGGDRFKETLGHLYFARSAEIPFSRDETGFLGQIADAVALAMDRLEKHEKSVTSKHEWEATFDAIVDPVCLISSDFTLVRVNRSFADRSFADGSKVESEKIIGRKCYEAIFGRNSPCEGCGLAGDHAPIPGVLSAGSSFRLKPASTVGAPQGQELNVIYDVFSQEIQFKHENGNLHVNMYHDMSSRIRLERQIVESAKMAELGTIGSSIAHELNNPLGGMLSFLQLIKMDMAENSPWRDDIDEMENAARRCRDIVQSLLGFTRKSMQDAIENIDLREVVEQALKITELQTRSMGITVHYELPNHPVEARGQFNSLAQALRNFLQNAQEAITERRRHTKIQGEIKVTLRVENNCNMIEIFDNGAGFDPKLGDLIYHPMYTTKDPASNPGLGLTVAQQIIRDHGGRVDISSIQDSGTSAKISFPRAEAVAVSSSF
jgi:signal transduction histidine kinase/PAS domain-containing protein